MIDLPGVYTMDEATYHADPVKVPSLSSGIARLILTQSPLHGWTAHPRLNPNFVPEERKEFDRGSATHALLLEGADRMAVIHANDWRTKIAQEARDAAREEGRYPILARVYDDILRMRDRALEAIARNRDLSGMTLEDGLPEQTLIWEEGGAWIRVRPDWLSHDRLVMIDYKSTKGSANPLDWVRTMAGLGGEVQGSLYRRGNAATGGPTNTKWLFLVQECEPPYSCSFVGLDPAFIALGDSKVEAAIRTWRQCMARNEWPEYPDRICWVEPPAWHAMRWEERQALGQNERHAIPYDPARMYEMYDDTKRAFDALPE